MLNWLRPFNIFCLLDNAGYDDPIPEFDCMIAIGGDDCIELRSGNAYESLKKFHQQYPSWLFGHLGYDLKNEDTHLHSAHTDRIGFAEGFFFRPEILIIVKNNIAEIFADDPDKIFNEINKSAENIVHEKRSMHIQQRISKEEYLIALQKIKAHIQRGDCYEINFCQEFFIEDAELDPVYIYHQLATISPNPFSAFYKINNRYCMSASPERFLKKKGNHLLSQPIKGTAKRSADVAVDKENFNFLNRSEKDKSENVMIVDLVRNDLSKVCERNSVKATSLFEIKTFPQVYQMISTVEGTLKSELHFADALQATFPMGSMTGAPKRRVMELIEQYESAKRGLYSGAIGYINPAGDFDFNVVIRSIFYNSEKKYASFWAGGGITIKSDAEKEYEECFMKTKAITNLFE